MLASLIDEVEWRALLLLGYGFEAVGWVYDRAMSVFDLFDPAD